MPTGVYKRDENYRKMMSAAQKKVGNRPPSKLGVKMSDETKRKIGAANAIANKGKKPHPKTTEGLEKLRVFNTGRKMSIESRRKSSESKLKNPIRYWEGKRRESMTGKNNWNWNNGSSYVGYSIDWTRTLKRSIRERDNYLCKVCGELQGDIAHDVHHIDYDKANCDPKNLITLCHRCHMRTNANRDYWKGYLNNLLK